MSYYVDKHSLLTSDVSKTAGRVVNSVLLCGQAQFTDF